MKEKDLKFKEVLYGFFLLFGSIAIWIQVTDNYPWKDTTSSMMVTLFLALFISDFSNKRHKTNNEFPDEASIKKWLFIITSLVAIVNLFL